MLEEYARSRGLEPRAWVSGPWTPRLVIAGQVATYQGGVWNVRDWDRLLLKCDALIVVLDSEPLRMDANLEHVQMLRTVRSVVWGCFVASKSELPKRTTPQELHRRLALGEEPFLHWPLYESTHRDPSTLLAPFDFLLEATPQGGAHPPPGSR